METVAPDKEHRLCGELLCQSFDAREIQTKIVFSALQRDLGNEQKKKSQNKRNDETSPKDLLLRSIETTDSNQIEFISVIFGDTVCFPEGGGQPCDFGWVRQIPESAHETENIGIIYDVKNENRECVHYVARRKNPCAEHGEEWLKVGTEVRIWVDWERRWDHMQQHSSQHLISALAGELMGAATVGWKLRSIYEGIQWPLTAESNSGSFVGLDDTVRDKEVSRNTNQENMLDLPEASPSGQNLPFSLRKRQPMITEIQPCYVDLDFSSLKVEEIDEMARVSECCETSAIGKFLWCLRRAVEKATEANHSIVAKLMTLGEAQEKGAIGRGLKHEDLPSKIRVVSIGEGKLDANLCCGTHVNSLGKLGAVVILEAEKLKGGKVYRVYFASGGRLRQIAENMAARELRLIECLTTPPREHLIEVERLKNSLKCATNFKNQYRAKWLRAIVLENASNARKLKTKDTGLHSGPGYDSETDNSTTSNAQRGIVVVPSFLIDGEIESADEAKCAVQDCLSIYKECVCTDGNTVGFICVARTEGLVVDALWSVVGPNDAVDKIGGPAVSAALGSRGGGRGGIFQGKMAFPAVGPNHRSTRELFESANHALQASFQDK